MTPLNIIYIYITMGLSEIRTLLYYLYNPRFIRFPSQIPESDDLWVCALIIALNIPDDNGTVMVDAKEDLEIKRLELPEISLRDYDISYAGTRYLLHVKKHFEGKEIDTTLNEHLFRQLVLLKQ